MKLVKESFNDGFKVKSGDTFYKTWTILNDGQHDWPKDTRLIFVNGNVFGEREKLICQDVKPGENIDIVLEFKAPEEIQLGQTERFVAFYKLVHGFNKKFGPTIWCDVEIVFPPLKEEKQEEDEL